MPETMHTPPPITGYRPLSQEDVERINELKGELASVGRLLRALERDPDCDARSVAIAVTTLQTLEMWAVRAITKPALAY